MKAKAAARYVKKKWFNMTKVVVCRRLLDVRKNPCLFLSRPMIAFWEHSRKKAILTKEGAVTS